MIELIKTVAEHPFATVLLTLCVVPIASIIGDTVSVTFGRRKP